MELLTETREQMSVVKGKGALFRGVWTSPEK